mgnify:CR=1 FL=1
MQADEARIEYVPRFEVAKGEQLSTMPRVGAFLTPNERGGLRGRERAKEPIHVA